MGEGLGGVREGGRGRVGSVLSGAAPDDQGVDMALVGGMRSLVATFPILEAEVTVVTTGYTQDIGALLPDLTSLLDVTYPYIEGCPKVRREFYQVVGLGEVRFYGAQPTAGEKMLVQYRPRYRLAGLQGSTEDTLPERYEPALAQAAAAHLMWIQATRRRAGGEIDEKAYNLAIAAVQNVLAAAESAVYNVSDRLNNHSWARVGL